MRSIAATPDAAGDAAFRCDYKWADLTGTFDVGTAAKLHRDIAHLHHANAIAVFLAEQRHRPGVDRGLLVHDFGIHRVVRHDFVIDDGSDTAHLGGRNWLD